MKMDMIEDIVYDALAHGLKEELLVNVLIHQKNQPHCNLNSVYLLKSNFQPFIRTVKTYGFFFPNFSSIDNN